MGTQDPINLAKFYFPYGFHRSKGSNPGINLYKKLQPIVAPLLREKAQVTIDLNDMKAFYGSFIDGAFGEFIDELKEDFFTRFIFISDKNPTHVNAIQRVYQLHVEKKFNAALKQNV